MRKKLIYIHHPSEIPKFKNEDEEAAFWETHRFSEECLRELDPPSGRTAALLRRYREQYAESMQRDSRS